ncbi:MAG: membrane protein insertion efficiency factor YidD [Pseudomonadota bacterium]
MNKIFIFLIRGYQKLISPLFGKKCRFYPSCSEYALKSFQKKPFHIALFKTIYRILRCNPWNDGGVDLP